MTNGWNAAYESWRPRASRIATARRPDNDGGLSRLGYELLDALADHNVLVDLSNMSARAIEETLQRYQGALIASHSGPRLFCDDERLMSDAAIRSLAERDGVMGIMLYNRYLRRDWHPADPKDHVTLSRWVDAVDYVCQLTGSVANVGLGSDIDGGYAFSQLPAELDSSSDLFLLGRLLRERGFTEDEAAMILGGNMLRKLRETLPDG